MQVEILNTDKRLGVKAGEVYEAEPYGPDPASKVRLIGRVPDGYDPECTQYRHEVRFLTGRQQ